jgi:hypothetical protein
VRLLPLPDLKPKTHLFAAIKRLMNKGERCGAGAASFDYHGTDK